MSFSRNGVRIWNNYLINFKRNIHNLLLQELTEENEYIELSDLPENAFEN